MLFLIDHTSLYILQLKLLLLQQNLLLIYLVLFILAFPLMAGPAGDMMRSTQSITTPFTFMALNGLILTGLSTTTEVLFDFLSHVCSFFFPFAWLVCEKGPWILNCPNPCHQLNLMIKGIMVRLKKYLKIKVFADVLHLNNLFTNLIIFPTNGYYSWANNILFSQQL